MCTPARGVCTSGPGVHELGRYGAPVTQLVRFRLDDDAAAAVDGAARPGGHGRLLRAAGATRPHRGRRRRDPTRRSHGGRRRVASARAADRLAGHARAAQRAEPTSSCWPPSSTPSCSPSTPRCTTHSPAGSAARSPRTCRAPGCRTACSASPARLPRLRPSIRWSRSGQGRGRRDRRCPYGRDHRGPLTRSHADTARHTGHDLGVDPSTCVRWRRGGRPRRRRDQSPCPVDRRRS